MYVVRVSEVVFGGVYVVLEPDNAFGRFQRIRFKVCDMKQKTPEEISEKFFKLVDLCFKAAKIPDDKRFFVKLADTRHDRKPDYWKIEELLVKRSSELENSFVYYDENDTEFYPAFIE